MSQIARDHFDLLYPLTVKLDERNLVLACSPRMAKLLGRDIAGESLLSVFSCFRPKLETVDGVVNLHKYARRLLLLVTVDERYAFRAQAIAAQRDGAEVIVLAMTPWLTWMKEHRSDYVPQFLDYPLQDSQLDMEIYLHTQQSMMNDLRELTQSLSTANAQLTQAMQVRTKFLSYVSHELRTPLTGIISALPLFESQALDEEGRDLLEVMKSSSQSLLEIINQVLDFNEATEGSDAMQVEVFDFTDLVEECLNICSLIANKKQLQLSRHVDVTLEHVWFESDRGKLKKILINLLGSAVKYTGSGRVQLNVRELEDTNTESRLMISIHDDGGGVLPEDVPRLFDTYWKKVKSTDTNTPSSGLGLSITKKLADVLGGEIGYRRSAECAGSEFWVELTLKKAPPQTEIRSSESRPVGEILDSAGLSGDVLLVDDNKVNLMIGKMTLERAGMKVVTTDSARDAIACCRDRRFVVILMDILMPEMSGLECSKLLRSEPGPNRDTPIIAWSAHCSREDMLRYSASGINDWLIKPPKPALLIDLMRKWNARRVDATIRVNAD